tara:strand:+ start:127 stop:927 length:801 start_codon:yes stop_codon:yes gene_type:complete
MLYIKKILQNPYFKDNILSCIKKCIKVALEQPIGKIEKKIDGSFVTSIDKKIDQVIRQDLSLSYPSIPIISEESHNNDNSFLQKFYWLIDPIDGTSSFIKGHNGYTINIALIYDGIAILGFIANPPTNSIWYGFEGNAYFSYNNTIKKITTNNIKKDKFCRIVCSKSYDANVEDFLKKIQNVKIKYYSSSIKFCKIAEGKANIYPRLHSISKWDIAAGDAILKSAGGILLDANGKIFKYDTATSKTGNFFALSSKFLWNSTIYNIL